MAGVTERGNASCRVSSIGFIYSVAGDARWNSWDRATGSTMELIKNLADNAIHEVAANVEDHGVATLILP
jgi:hypothetical protein